MKAIATGYVSKICRKTFYWRFKLSSGLNTTHEGQVRISKLNLRERKLLSDGAYLSLLKGGTFRFLRHKITKREVKAAMKRAHSLLHELFPYAK